MTATADRVDEFEERRRELADAALESLIEHGCARTSLPEIAKTSAVSRSALHSCFRDETELAAYCRARRSAGDRRGARRYLAGEATAAAELRTGTRELLRLVCC